MEHFQFKLETEYIELIKLLKLTQIAESGGMAKTMVDNGEVKLNGVVEHRKRAKLRASDIIEVFDMEILII